MSQLREALEVLVDALLFRQVAMQASDVSTDWVEAGERVDASLAALPDDWREQLAALAAPSGEPVPAAAPRDPDLDHGEDTDHRSYGPAEQRGPDEGCVCGGAVAAIDLAYVAGFQNGRNPDAVEPPALRAQRTAEPDGEGADENA